MGRGNVMQGQPGWNDEPRGTGGLIQTEDAVALLKGAGHGPMEIAEFLNRGVLGVAQKLVDRDSKPRLTVLVEIPYDVDTADPAAMLNFGRRVHSVLQFKGAVEPATIETLGHKDTEQQILLRMNELQPQLVTLRGQKTDSASDRVREIAVEIDGLDAMLQKVRAHKNSYARYVVSQA